MKKPTHSPSSQKKPKHYKQSVAHIAATKKSAEEVLRSKKETDLKIKRKINNQLVILVKKGRISEEDALKVLNNTNYSQSQYILGLINKYNAKAASFNRKIGEEEYPMIEYAIDAFGNIIADTNFLIDAITTIDQFNAEEEYFASIA